MEGYIKCSEDLEFIYYKCKNQKTKHCKSTLKEAKTSGLIIGTVHIRACKLAEKRKKENDKNKIDKSIEKEVKKKLELEEKKNRRKVEGKLMNEIKFNEIKFQLEGEAKSIKQSVSFGDNISGIEKKSNNTVSFSQSCLETNSTQMEISKHKENYKKCNLDNNTKSREN
jgi:hypothetical protein